MNIAVSNLAVSNIAVSNIAWDSADEDAIVQLLRREGVRGVELAPTKWRDNPFDAPAADVAALRRRWEDVGLHVVSIQSLLFGRPDLQLFGDASSRAALDDFLRRAIDFAAAVAAHALVFGSPKNRVRGAMPLAEAMAVATDFFSTLGDHADSRGTPICIEANPPAYGCDFITTTSEAIELCNAVDHPGIAINADLGGMAMSGEDPGKLIETAGLWVRHVHASEPNLAELGASADHAGAAQGLSAIGYDGWVSIEMRAAGGGENVAAVERAVKIAKRYYAPSSRAS